MERDASYDRPALPHFTGRGDLEATLSVVKRHVLGAAFIAQARPHPLSVDRYIAIKNTLATADTPPEEMR